MMIALLAIGGIVLVSTTMAYFMGYAQGRREQQQKEATSGFHVPHKCSCGTVTLKIKGLTSRTVGKVGLVTGNTYHQIPPYVCHPVHDAVLGKD